MKRPRQAAPKDWRGIGIGTITLKDGAALGVWFSGDHGTTIYAMEPDHARRLAADLIDRADRVDQFRKETK